MRNYRRALLVFAAVLTILVGEWIWLTLGHRNGPTVAAPLALPTTAPGGAFVLIDHANRPIRDTDFRGRFILILFGYTHCPDVCPAALQTMIEALDRTGPFAGRIQPLFVTVDPDRDTPAVLADYVSAFDDRLIGLTGSVEQIDAARKAFRVYAKRPPADGDDDGDGYIVDHSAFIYLLGPDGHTIDYWAHDMPVAEMQTRLVMRMRETFANENERRD